MIAILVVAFVALGSGRIEPLPRGRKLTVDGRSHRAFAHRTAHLLDRFVQRQAQHRLAVDVRDGVAGLHTGAQRALLAFCDLLTIALLAPVTWWGWNNARTLDIMQSISLGLPLSIFAYSIPVTAGLMIVFSLGLLARRFSASPIRSGGGAVEVGGFGAAENG